MLYFLNSALTIVLALFFFLTGILSFLLPFSSSAQEAAVSLIQSHFWVWILFGFGSFLIGSAFATYTYFINRKNYLTTKSGPYTTSISESVIQSYLQNYFEMLFPKTQIPYRLLLKKRKYKSLQICLAFLKMNKKICSQQWKKTFPSCSIKILAITKLLN